MGIPRIKMNPQYVLAQCWKKILNKLINEDQKGYIKNRFIGFNL